MGGFAGGGTGVGGGGGGGGGGARRVGGGGGGGGGGSVSTRVGTDAWGGPRRVRGAGRGGCVGRVDAGVWGGPKCGRGCKCGARPHCRWPAPRLSVCPQMRRARALGPAASAPPPAGPSFGPCCSQSSPAPPTRPKPPVRSSAPNVSSRCQWASLTQRLAQRAQRVGANNRHECVRDSGCARPGCWVRARPGRVRPGVCVHGQAHGCVGGQWQHPHPPSLSPTNGLSTDQFFKHANC